MNAAIEAGEELAPATPAHATRPFYWSIRRELWESRSLIIAPLVGVGVILLGLIIAAMHLSHSLQAHSMPMCPARSSASASC
jgi:hypothetical protein